MEKPIGDMYLAAALVSYGGTLVRIDKADNRHQKFVFEDLLIELDQYQVLR